MKSKKRLLKKSRLYAIVDKKTCGRKPLDNIVNRIIGSGADLVQFRDKESKKEDILKEALLLRRVLLNSKTLFIINDYLDVAKILDCDGLHLGQNDASIEIARAILGKDKIIGVSCHNLKEALEAQKRGADYIGIGPVFPTATKPKSRPIGLDLIRELKDKIKIPFFAIGDINLNNISRVLLSPVKRVAVCRAILQAKNISLAVKNFSEILRS